VIFSHYRVELKRLALSKFTWVAAVFSLCSPLLGYWMQLSNPDVMTGQFIANPVLAGTIVGAVIWALLIIVESNRIYRAQASMLIDAIASPRSMALIRVAAVMTFSGLIWLLSLLIYLPYTMLNLGFLFTIDLYVLSFLVLMLPTWWISILFASALSQISQRIELTGLLYAFLVFFSFSGFISNNLFGTWLNPIVLTFSDGFSSLYFLRIAFYTRLLWLTISGGLWVFSLLCIRKYQKNIFGSFWIGIRKAYIPAAAGLLFFAGVFLWINQPFVDHGPAEFIFEDFVSPSRDNFRAPISEVTYRLSPNTSTGRLHGVAEFNAEGARQGTSGSSSIWLNPGYRIISIEYDNNKADFTTTPYIIRDARRTDFTTTESWQTLRITYEGFPTMIRAFAPHNWGNEINRRNITLNNASSIPTVSGLSIPVSFNLELALPSNMIPVINHRLIDDYITLTCGTNIWNATIDGSSLRINAADYMVESFVAADMNVDFIFSRQYQAIMEEYNISGEIAEVLDFFTQRLGPLHWAHLPSLSMLQSSALMFGGIAGDGFVEWGESIFTVSNLDNPLQGTNAAEVFVHEMVHMWWGGLGVFSGWGESGDIWSDEGLTVYYTYRFFKYRYGEEHARQHFVDAWQAAVDIQNRCFYSRNPEFLDRLPEMYCAQINNRNRGTNLYARMPLMILRAEELVGGPEQMDELMRHVQQQFSGNGMNRPFTFQDFLDAVGLSEEDINLDYPI